MVQWESHNELNAYRLLDATPGVTSFHEQPLTIKFRLNGENHTHYPDVLVESGQSHELWEIKPRADALAAEVDARTKFLETALPNFGFTYRVVIAEDLKREPHLTNVLTFLKYGRGQVAAFDRERIRKLLAATHVLRWGAAASGTLGANGRAVLSRLVLEGFISVDLDQPLCTESVFALATSTNRRI